MAKLRLATSCVLFLGFLAGCQSSIALPQPAIGPPTQDPPHQIVETLAVEGGVVADSQEWTGLCVHLYLWSEVDDGSEWLPVAQNSQLVTADFRDEEGNEVGCELVGLAGPTTYDLPLGDVPDGWYVVCNLANECSPPFEKA